MGRGQSPRRQLTGHDGGQTHLLVGPGTFLYDPAPSSLSSSLLSGTSEAEAFPRPKGLRKVNVLGAVDGSVPRAHHSRVGHQLYDRISNLLQGVVMGNAGCGARIYFLSDFLERKKSSKIPLFFTLLAPVYSTKIEVF